MRRKIYSTDSGWSDAISSLPRQSAWRAKKRGWCFLNYHQKEICIDPKNYDHETARKAAMAVIVKYDYPLKGWADWDDFFQCVYLRIYELSGKETSSRFSFYYRVAKNVLRNLSSLRDYEYSRRMK